VDPLGDNYSVPESDLIRGRVVMNVNTPGTFEFTINNPAGARNSLYEMDDVIDIYIDTDDPPTKKKMTGRIEEIEITRPAFGQTLMTMRGQDPLTVLAYRLATVESQGTVNIGTILTNLVTEFGEGEYTTNNVSGGIYTQTDFTVGTRTSLLNIMRKMAELPNGNSYDFYIDASNDIHWHLRGNSAYDSGVTLAGDNIRSFTSRRSVKDRKTHIHIQGAQTPKEESSSTHNTVTDSVTLDANHYADDFIAEHNNIMRAELYVQKVGSPGVNLVGRVSVSKHGDPSGDFKDFTIREEEIGTDAGWHTIPMGIDTIIGVKYFIKLDRAGDDASNTYKWYGDTPAVLDTENKARVSVATSGLPPLLWTESDYDFSMKVHYGEFVEVSSSSSDTPKREAIVQLPRAMDNVTAQALADRLQEIYLATAFYASITTDAPNAELKPGDLITLNETGSGLASKTYRMESIDWEFGPRNKAETVTLDISAELPYESKTEITSRMLEELMNATGSQLKSGATEGAEPDLVGRSTIGRSLVGYQPG